MKKKNQKCIRMTDEVLQYIENFEGNGFNQKFENLVLFCMKKEESKRQRINYLDDEIKVRQKFLDCLGKLERETITAERLLRRVEDNVSEYVEHIKGMALYL